MQCIYMYQVVWGSGAYCTLTLIWYNRKLHEINNPKQLLSFYIFPSFLFQLQLIALSRFVFVTISSIAF